MVVDSKYCVDRRPPIWGMFSGSVCLYNRQTQQELKLCRYSWEVFYSMRKKTIVILSLLAVGLGIVSIIAFVVAGVLTAAACSPDCSSSGQAVPVVATIGIVIGVILSLAASGLSLAAMIGALIKQAKQQKWGWFVCTILFGIICVWIYLIAVPETPQYPMPSYLAPSPYQPGVQYPPMQSYQPMEGYPSAQPYQPMPQYPPAEQYPSAPQQYPPQG